MNDQLARLAQSDDEILSCLAANGASTICRSMRRVGDGNHVSRLADPFDCEFPLSVGHVLHDRLVFMPPDDWLIPVPADNRTDQSLAGSDEFAPGTSPMTNKLAPATGLPW